MSQDDWKLVWKNLNDGKLEKVLQHLKKAKDVPEGHSLYLVYLVYTYLKKNSVNDNIISILNLIPLDKVTKIKWKSYLQYIQVLLGLLLTEENEKYILQIRNVLMPPFLGSLNSEDLTVYLNTVKIFFCNILEKKVVKNYEQTFDLLMFCTEMSAFCGKKGSENGVIKYFKPATHRLLLLKFDLPKVFAFYKKFLEIFGSNFGEVIKVLAVISANTCNNEERIFISATPKYLSCDESFLQLFPAVAGITGTILEDTKDFQTDLRMCIKCIRSGYDGGTKLKQDITTICVFLTSTIFEHNSINCKMTNATLSLYISLIDLVNNVIKDVSHKCCCNINRNIDMQVSNFSFLCNLIKLKNGTFNTVSSEFWEELNVFLKDFIKNLILMIFYKCNKLGVVWNLIGRQLYNLSLTLYKEGVLESTKYMKIFLKFVLKIEGRNDKMITDNAGANICNMYSSMLFKHGMFKDAAVILAMGFYLYPQVKNESQHSKWIECKLHLKSGITIMKLLNDNCKAIKYFDESFEGVKDEEVLIDLYFRELRCYVMHEKYSDAGKVLKEITRLKGSSVVIGRHLVALGFKIVLNFPIENRDLITDVFNDLKYKPTSDNEIILGYLSYIIYRYKVSEIILKNKDDMDNAVVIKKDSTNEEPKDVNDECDVVSNYRNLEIKNHKEVLQKLINALDYFKALNKVQASDTIYETLIEMGHDFYMNCLLDKADTTFNLALRAATQLKNNNWIFKAITYLIETITTKEETSRIPKLTASAESIITNESPDKTHKLYYYINLCSFYLSTGDTKKALAVHESIKNVEFKDENYTYSKAVVHAKYLMLQAKIYNLPCSYNVEKHQDFALIQLEKAYKLIMGIRKNQTYTETNWILSTLFDITEHLLATYVWMYLPREVRCYGKDSLLLAQKLVLPFRTARLLIYLTRADLITCNFNDCIVKLEGLTEILNLNNTYEKQELTNKSEVEAITSGLHDMLLEIPSTSYPRAATTGSPTLYTEPFKIPSFITDPKGCNCFYCNNIEYVNLILQKILLDALYADSQKYYHATNDYYTALFKMHKKIKSPHLDFTYSEILLNYAKFSFKVDNVERSLVVTSQIILTMELQAETTTSKYLYDEALNLNTTLLNNFDIFPAKTITKLIKTPDNCNLKVPILKTPENKFNDINIKLETPILSIKKPGRKVKKIAINFDRSPELVKGVSQKENKKPCLLEQEFKTPNNIEKINAKTRALTEKLKSSQKLKNVENIKVGKVVKKNLANDLIDNVNVNQEEKGVRRSRRAR